MPDLGILIVDDHQVVREGLRSVIAADPGLRISGEAVDGLDACVKGAALRPDVVIMDLSMPGMNGAEATRRLVAAAPATLVIGLSAHEEPPYVRELLEAGARGYVLKRAVLTSLMQAIRVVAAGGVFLDPALTQRAATAPSEIAVPAADLSAREAEVASLTARGYTNAEIAGALRVSTKTIETHKSHLMAKLGLTTRAQLVRYAIFRGWLTV